MYSSKTENVPLESETIFSERRSWLDMLRGGQRQHGEQMVSGRLALSVIHHMFVSVQLSSALQLPTEENNKIWPDEAANTDKMELLGVSEMIS